MRTAKAAYASAVPTLALINAVTAGLGKSDGLHMLVPTATGDPLSSVARWLAAVVCNVGIGVRPGSA